jgi:NAD-dependent deacetylase
MSFAPETERQLDRIVAEMKKCHRLLFITGAGMSADSGMPTYRGIGGLYNREVTEDGVPIEEALSGRMLRQQPEVCWKYIAEIEAACRGADPNPGHQVLSDLQDRFEVIILTQNVDGLHRRAGSKDVIEIHGDVHDLHCTQCDYEERVENYRSVDIPPSCPECRSLVRPRVVLFGEMLPQAAIKTLHTELSLGIDMVFSVGTTSVFPYIAGPVIEAQRGGIPTVEINPGKTEVTSFVEEKVPYGAAVTLGALWRRLQP